MQNRVNDFELYPLFASPIPSRALFRLMVVIVNEPLCVPGIPAYIYCMLRALLTVRLALRSILRSRTGSRVTRTCRSSLADVVAGVATLSLLSSQLLS